MDEMIYKYLGRSTGLINHEIDQRNEKMKKPIPRIPTPFSSSNSRKPHGLVDDQVGRYARYSYLDGKGNEVYLPLNGSLITSTTSNNNNSHLNFSSINTLRT
ncbi:uncharacterized protein MELLADRAFT_71998 [Melampsora larici-populina 98AG31]|uniref:Uncharacterized protein n=1 Tax=Melampsora larici-populina (strain 98AG31 / pathotype 3-4-7) TaxID=747676 RepID=F4RNF6_MELLP|nr:uncharacterized protein MELLADRAFT_71998 [Melampsora larici-populina 98AG31]EGG05980.1 hypothetical protein MELLADRAFT_71998 [Melampsora larici-populina 98AG31]